jgi:Flp pilus assembly protein TadG
MMRRLRQRDGERGQAAVELALVVSVLSLILMATVQFGQAFIDMHELSNAATEGARTAAVSSSSATKANDVQTAVRNSVKLGALGTSLTSSNLTVATCSTSGSSCTPSTNDATTWLPGQIVTVRVTYPETITVLGVTFFNGNLSRTRTMRVSS